MKSAIESVPPADTGVRDAAYALMAALTPFHARALVTACMFFETQTAGSRKSKETPLVTGVEYLALLLADRITSDAGKVPSYAEAANIAFAYRNVFDAAIRAIQSRDKLVGEHAFGRLALSGLAIRNPGVPQHWSAILSSLAVTTDAYFLRGLHFTLTDALLVQRTLVERTLSKANAWLQDLNDRGRRLGWALKARRIAPMSADDYAIIELARSYPRGSQKKHLHAILVDAAMKERPEVFTVSLREISDASKLDSSIVSLVMEALTMSSTPIEYRILPSSHNALARTPCMALRRERWFIPHPALVLWAVLPRLEELLLDIDPHQFDLYERARAKFLECAVAQLLEDIGFRTERNVAVTANGKQFEIDVLAQLDTTALVVECKAGAFSEAARRGGTRSLDHGIRKLLLKAAVQAARGSDAIAVDPESFGLDGVREFVPVVVTLDQLQALMSGPQALSHAGFLPGVWPISLCSLHTIADLVGSGWRLKHYIRRRLLVDPSRFSLAMDDVDYYDVYTLFNICAFPTLPSGGVVHVAIDDSSNYYFGLANGLRWKKPVPSTPRSLTDLIENLHRGSQLGWSDAACDLLDYAYSVQDEIGEGIDRSRQAAASGGSRTIRLMDMENGIAVTYVAYKHLHPETVLTLTQVWFMSDRDHPKPMRCLMIIDDILLHEARAFYYCVSDGNWQRVSTALDVGEDGLLVRLHRRGKPH
jgi:hypothetical protein